MFVADIQIDRDVSRAALVDAVAVAFGVAPDEVSIWPVGNVADAGASVVLQVGRVGGDFQTLLRIAAAEAIAAQAKRDLLQLVRAIAASLDAAVITDSVGVEPAFDDDWLLVTPHGATAVVRADLDALTSDVPTVILVPESRATYALLMRRELAAAG